jgi:ABC-2 type transport system permease protein
MLSLSIATIRGKRPDARTRWLRVVADWNPFSAIAAACRQLFGNPNPSALSPAWPMQHPQLAALLWSAALLVVFVPLAVRLYSAKER